jgi:hypothetical protein
MISHQLLTRWARGRVRQVCAIKKDSAYEIVEQRARTTVFEYK